ncbi:UDP-N-acetylglucosamine transferase subunit ALG14 homolog [Vanessa atalanta]|uniref:UDP-N-acetylglucosamine transferase subunit ALG14 homolog n=1 Tax=Vanessa atalanta TaxID=42275 RepID=UPI001FCCD95F|nr:UDP-N-acetylglucosamine transferase subunit ALG14 homolog [Vanessa atalanta]
MGFILYLAMSIIAAFITRVFFLFHKILKSDCQLISPNSYLRTIYCIGSGGHTTELLRLMSHLDSKKFQPRLFILAKNDISSEVKIQEAVDGSDDYTLYRIPRSRNVKQSYISSVFTTIYATLSTIPILFKFKPDVIFCNGPGTCVPVCLVSFLMRCLFILDCRIVFIESLCRVQTLSLSGIILQYFADIFIIQWPQLRHVCFRAKYFGRLT